MASGRAPPPPPTGLPSPGLPAAPPPPPAGLPGAPGSTGAAGDGAGQRSSLSGAGRGTGAAGYSSGAGAGGRSAPPPPPMGLPLAQAGDSNSSKPPPPCGLPGANPPPPMGLPSGGQPGPAASGRPSFAGAPPPPASLPVARTGPSESGFNAAPPPPSSFPGVLPAGRKSTGGARMAPPPPPAPGELPGIASQTPTVTNFPPEPDEEVESTEAPPSWKEYIEEDSSEDDSGSGEDSDENLAEPSLEDRQKSDMDLLLRQQSKMYSGRPSQRSSSLVAECEQGRTLSSRAEASDDKAAEKEDATGATPSASTSSKKKGSIISRLSSGIFGSNNMSGQAEQGHGLVSLMKEGVITCDDAWLQRWAPRLGKDGLACTKVATNGKPYERRIHVDSRNLTIEIRGGRGGATGVLLDDLVDVRLGIHSPEFSKFASRFKKDVVRDQQEITKRAVVLQTPARTYSFLFSTENQRDTVAQFVVYLLKSKNRGMMASGPTEKCADKGVKDGYGSITYPTRSSYEGQFQCYMRHGQGTLTLSDGTKYECEWRHDERHGEGKEYWADGTIFEGTYVKGMRNGHGVMTWPEGSKYAGQFKRGRANGEGELVRTDGSVYHGLFSEDCMCGEGRMQWRDGVEYVGQFVGNRREGFGRMVWTTGRWKSYEGHWKDGVQHGHGTLIDRNDSEFSGTFCAGKLDRWDDDL